jgi:hypothetical protein
VRRPGRGFERPAFRAAALYFAPRATGFRATRDDR